METPTSREWSNLDQNVVSPKSQKQCAQCRCKYSRCLRMYCECFGNGVYCDGCNCINCYNRKENEADRKEAIDAILKRNPSAFNRVEYKKGCFCKKMGCLKNYCECLKANIVCSDKCKCKCKDCKNFEGSEESKKNLLFQYSANLLLSTQLANDSRNKAIGTTKESSSSLLESHKGIGSIFDGYVEQSKTNPTTLAFPKASYRAPLSGIPQAQDVKDLCRDLVEVSVEVTWLMSKKGLF